MNLFRTLRKMNLLLIDDDEWVRDSLYLFFKCEGCNIVALESAEKGLEILKKQRFDIIIADYRLPGIDGIEFIGRLPPGQADVLKVLITAYGSNEIISKAKKAGFDDTLLKPFDSDAIEASLKRLIGMPVS